jgi:PPOX class probable F420-dependent enzyme
MVDISSPLVQELLHGRHVASLATENADGSIHMTAVWYLFEGDCLYVATASRTAKARNLSVRPKASLMVDVREGVAARGVTAIGHAEILTGEESQKWNRAIHERYLTKEALKDPRIGTVFAQWDDITIRLKPTRFLAWDMREADKQAFGGAFAAHPDYMLPLD